MYPIDRVNLTISKLFSKLLQYFQGNIFKILSKNHWQFFYNWHALRFLFVLFFFVLIQCWRGTVRTEMPKSDSIGELCVNIVLENNINVPYSFSEIGLVYEMSSCYLHLKNGKNYWCYSRNFIAGYCSTHHKLQHVYFSGPILHIKRVAHMAKK